MACPAWWALQDRRADGSGSYAPEPPSFDDLCQFIVELSGPQFTEMFESGDPNVIGRLLCARLYHPRICAKFVERGQISGSLGRWATRQPATRLAQFLL